MNKGPQMHFVNKKDKKMKRKIYTDVFDKTQISKYPKNIQNDFVRYVNLFFKSDYFIKVFNRAAHSAGPVHGL